MRGGSLTSAHHLGKEVAKVVEARACGHITVKARRNSRGCLQVRFSRYCQNLFRANVPSAESKVWRLQPVTPTLFGVRYRFHSKSANVPPKAPVLRRGGGRKCSLQFSIPHRYECVNCRIPHLGPRFAATSCRASHACPCSFPLDTDTGNCRKTCPTIMYPPPLSC